MTIPATQGQPVVFSLILEQGEDYFFPQVEVYAAGSVSPEVTLDLVHRAKGRYEAEWIPSSVGSFTAQFFIYVDAAHLVETVLYSREAEQVFVTQSSTDDLAASLARVLGLVHENAFIDMTNFDAADQLLSARVRIFDSKSAVQAATDGGVESTGLVATYSIEATYESAGRMRQYRMTKE